MTYNREEGDMWIRCISSENEGMQLFYIISFTPSSQKYYRRKLMSPFILVQLLFFVKRYMNVIFIWIQNDKKLMTHEMWALAKVHDPQELFFTYTNIPRKRNDSMFWILLKSSCPNHIHSFSSWHCTSNSI